MTKHRRTPAGAYLNVDLEVRARSDLSMLVGGLSRVLFNVHTGRVAGAHFASFEAPTCGADPDSAICAMVKVVESLPRRTRAAWDRAEDRVFDIGIEHARGAWPFALGLRQDTLNMIAAINARVAITLYPVPRSRRALPNKPLQRTALVRRR
jgi:hypothetical protein